MANRRSWNHAGTIESSVYIATYVYGTSMYNRFVQHLLRYSVPA